MSNMGLPKIVDEITMKRWKPKVNKKEKCFLYDFKNMGITPSEFADVIAGRKAYIFEQPFNDKLRAVKCPWCDFKESKRTEVNDHPVRLQDHIFSHGKNVVSLQVLKFQKDLYSLRLQFVRNGYHECIAMLVEHECQFCLEKRVKGRELMCSIPTSTRNRMRSLKKLGYPIEHILNNKKREFSWSALGVIVLIESG